MDGSYVGDDEIGELVDDLWCTNVEDIHDPDLKAALHLFLDPENEEAKSEVAGILENGIKEVRAWYRKEVQEKSEALRKEQAEGRKKDEALRKEQAEGRKKDEALQEKDDEIALLKQQLAALQQN